MLGFSSLPSMIAALAAVLALVWVAARLARHTGLAPRNPSGARLLALRDALALDARRRLLVVRCGAQDLVLLTGGSQDLVVGWIPPAPLPGSGSAPGQPLPGAQAAAPPVPPPGSGGAPGQALPGAQAAAQEPVA